MLMPRNEGASLQQLSKVGNRGILEHAYSWRNIAISPTTVDGLLFFRVLGEIAVYVN